METTFEAIGHRSAGDVAHATVEVDEYHVNLHLIRKGGTWAVLKTPTWGKTSVPTLDARNDVIARAKGQMTHAWSRQIPAVVSEVVFDNTDTKGDALVDGVVVHFHSAWKADGKTLKAWDFNGCGLKGGAYSVPAMRVAIEGAHVEWNATHKG